MNAQELMDTARALVPGARDLAANGIQCLGVDVSGGSRIGVTKANRRKRAAGPGVGRGRMRPLRPSDVIRVAVQ
jgi:hypothetical protein